MASTITLPVKQKIPKIPIPHLSSLIIILIVNILLIVGILLLRDKIPPTVPLFYGRPRGVEQLAPQLFLLLPPSLSILVAIFNTIVMALFEDEFIRKVLVGIAFAATLLSTITVIKIILLVGSI